MEQDRIRCWAEELGFSKIGICNIAAFNDQKNMVDSQPFIKERKQLRYEPKKDYPWAQSLLVLLYPYLPSKLPEEENELFVDSYYWASNQAYRAAAELENRIVNAGYRAKANVSYPAKAAAVRAGMGIIGDHGLLITPEHGTRVVIILIATDAVKASRAEILDAGECLHCRKCEIDCPTGAIDVLRGFHPEICLRNYMMEGTVVPKEMRGKMGNRLLGCDVCQRACPMQPRMRFAAADRFWIDDFIADEKALIERLQGYVGKNIARPMRVKAQIALNAGNQKDHSAFDTLNTWKKMESEAVRIHCEWALKQMDENTLDQTYEKR